MDSFKHIAIIGGGLIGSSIARAVSELELAERLSVIETAPEARKVLGGLDIADHVAAAPDDSLKDADLVILAVPPSQMGAAAKQLEPFLSAEAVVTDVGSVKSDIVAAVTPFIPDGAVFIPGHPIAGTENSGPRAGFSSLFEDRWCILTPEGGIEAAGSAHVQKLQNFWQALGSQVAVMTPREHDIILATTSHVPHLIAYSLVGTAMDMETVTRNDVVKFSAGGFRDFTRIAASDPKMWRDVFLANRDSVLEVVDRFIEDLTALKRAIRWEDGDEILNRFEKGRDIRRRIIEAGQDSDEPNFGRDHIDPEEGG